MIREAGADQAVLTLKSLEAFAKAATAKRPRSSSIRDPGGGRACFLLKEIITEEPKSQN